MFLLLRLCWSNCLSSPLADANKTLFDVSHCLFIFTFLLFKLAEKVELAFYHSVVFRNIDAYLN
jgi:hypothetical protein